MTDTRILVVGAGPAGLRAAITLAEAGHHPVLIDHAPGIGGAVYATLRRTEHGKVAHAKEARKLKTDFDRLRPKIDLRCSTGFSGLDSQGTALLTGKGGLIFKPRAVILATGARERIRPRPGGTLAGVTSAGALQVALKTAGTLPPKRLLLAGSGALLYAIGAQLVKAGRAPVAILETGQPFRNAQHARALPGNVLLEAAGYMTRLIAARVPIVSGTEVTRIARADDCLLAYTTHTGRYAKFRVDHIALHDGLLPNDYGLDASSPDTPVFRAGDCDGILGRHAAEESGRLVAQQVLAVLQGQNLKLTLPPHYDHAQEGLARLFKRAPKLPETTGLTDLPDETVICRCENRTLGDLRSSLSGNSEYGPATGRSLRLGERVGMGACQGRQCLEWVAQLAPDSVGLTDLCGARWPLKPVRIHDILAAPDDSKD